MNPLLYLLGSSFGGGQGDPQSQEDLPPGWAGRRRLQAGPLLAPQPVENPTPEKPLGSGGFYDPLGITAGGPAPSGDYARPAAPQPPAGSALDRLLGTQGTFEGLGRLPGIVGRGMNRLTGGPDQAAPAQPSLPAPPQAVAQALSQLAPPGRTQNEPLVGPIPQEPYTRNFYNLGGLGAPQEQLSYQINGDKVGPATRNGTGFDPNNLNQLESMRLADSMKQGQAETGLPGVQSLNYFRQALSGTGMNDGEAGLRALDLQQKAAGTQGQIAAATQRKTPRDQAQDVAAAVFAQTFQKTNNSELASDQAGRALNSWLEMQGEAGPKAGLNPAQRGQLSADLGQSVGLVGAIQAAAKGGLSANTLAEPLGLLSDADLGNPGLMKNLAQSLTSGDAAFNRTQLGDELAKVIARNHLGMYYDAPGDSIPDAGLSFREMSNPALRFLDRATAGSGYDTVVDQAGRNIPIGPTTGAFMGRFRSQAERDKLVRQSRAATALRNAILGGQQR